MLLSGNRSLVVDKRNRATRVIEKDEVMPLIGALAPGSHSIRINGIEQRYHVAGQGPLCIVHPGRPGVDCAYLNTCPQHLVAIRTPAKISASRHSKCDFTRHSVHWRRQHK